MSKLRDAGINVGQYCLRPSPFLLKFSALFLKTRGPRVKLGRGVSGFRAREWWKVINWAILILSHCPVCLCFGMVLFIVRMNFSHGRWVERLSLSLWFFPSWPYIYSHSRSYDYHQSVINNARETERSKPGRPLAIALDTVSIHIRLIILSTDSEGLAIC